MKPLLKWAGGKSRLAPEICNAFGAQRPRVYLEPFLGSCAVYLYRKAQGQVDEAVLADINVKLVYFHIAVRDQVDDVLHELSRMPADEDWKVKYLGIREAFNAGPWSGPLHAARFLWLNRAGFNGLYRENRSGRFNVPAGSYRTVRLPDEAHMRAVSEALKPATLKVADFRDILARAERGDHVYCDPPYVPLSQTAAFTAYSGGGFDMRAQKALALASSEAAKRGATVVLSNHDLPLVRHELYPVKAGFEIKSRPEVSRAIARSVRSRKPVREVIACVGPGAKVA